MGDFCHSKDIHFIVADTRGLFGFVLDCQRSISLQFEEAILVSVLCRQSFCDFGKKFVVNDVNGEPPATAMIELITKV